MTRDLLDFRISFIGSGKDANFNNNRFYSFKLHRYTNIRDFNESAPLTKSQDIDIPLIPCNKSDDIISTLVPDIYEG